MKKIIVGLLATAALIFGSALPAAAAGSDGPTPYNVNVQGIYLPDGDVFTDGSHVNVKNDKGESFSIHFEKKYADPSNAEWKNLPFNHQDPRNQFYGQSFLPWEALSNFDAKNEFCITWVQIHTNNGYNEHFGEGGQEPVGTGCETPPDLIEPSAWTNMVFTCDTKVGDVIDRSREVKVTKYKWDGSVKSVETVTETGTYTVVDSDLWNLDCRKVVDVVVPTLKLASATCVAEEPIYTPAVLTLPEIENGVWTSDGKAVSGDVTLARGESVKFVFSVNDDKLFKVGSVPASDNTFWSAVVEDKSIIFTVTPNVVKDLTDCELANSGMDTPVWAMGAGAAALMIGGTLYFVSRKKALVEA